MANKEYEMGSANNGRKRGPGAGRIVEKPKDFRGTFIKLFKYLKKFLPFMVLSLLLSFISSILAVVGPDVIKDLTAVIENGILTGIDMEAVKDVAILLIIIYGISVVFQYFQSLVMATMTQKMSKKIRKDISEKINIMPLKYFDSTTFGDVLSRVTNDVDTIGHSLGQSITQLVMAVTMLIGSIIMMLITDVTMTIAAILSSLIGFAFMSLILGKSQKYFVGQQKYLGMINGHVEEVYAGHNVLKAYNGERKAKEEFEEINAKLCTSAFKAQFLSGLMQPFMGFVGNLGYVVVCVTGAVLVMMGKIDFPVIVAFTMYVRLFTQPLSQIAQSMNSMQSTVAASERIFEFLEEPPMEDESHKTKMLKGEDIKGEIEFNHVKFGYDPEKIIIKDFSVKIKPGQKIAIVGPTGAGKTTMVNLLMRFYEVNSGSISIDGTPVCELTRENIHDLFGMVLQDTWLFEGTIRDNIVYGKEGITDEMLDKVCKAAGIYHFIRTLPKGYDTILNDKVNLSAGQKQLMTIARAMVENAPMLILDEATSSVDTRTEVLIQEAMDRLTKGRTSFVIAHRLSTIRNADMILVMKDGDVIESGSHNELMKQGGFYSELYNSQFEQAS
ncbi:MAG: ABC transporter ATP-binding protein [Lachnospiraceae bacterium]|nr:ABC transporter ATP-binding protein [Lachnospiraceae bacterium]